MVAIDNVAPPSAWVGSPPARSAVAAAFVLGVTGVLVAGLQPVMLGQLHAAGRITSAQLGHAATLELLTLGLGAWLAEALFEQRRLRPLGLGIGLAYAGANLLTLVAHGEIVTLVRGLAGLPGGAAIWLVTGMIVRAPTPARWSGVYLAMQTLAQFAVAATLGIVASGRTDAAPLIMCGFGLASAGAAFLLPPLYAPLHREPTRSGLPPARGWAVLGVGALLQACIIGVWVYLEPLGTQAHLSVGVITAGASVLLAMQVAGAACATWATGKVPWLLALVGSGLGLGGAAFGIAMTSGPVAFLILQGTFGFLWLFMLPFLTPFAIAVDATRRTALLGPGANLIGASLGPFAASALVGDANAQIVLRLSATLIVIAMALTVAIAFQARAPR